MDEAFWFYYSLYDSSFYKLGAYLELVPKIPKLPILLGEIPVDLGLDSLLSQIYHE